MFYYQRQQKVFFYVEEISQNQQRYNLLPLLNHCNKTFHLTSTKVQSPFLRFSGRFLPRFSLQEIADKLQISKRMTNSMKYRVSHKNARDFISYGTGKDQTKFTHGPNPDWGLASESSWRIFNPSHPILQSASFFKSHLSSKGLTYTVISADFEILSIHQHI